LNYLKSLIALLKHGRLASVSEVQLIGRGVRYIPFHFEDKHIGKRKFYNNLEYELLVLEEFYYHSDDDHRYIDVY